MDIEREEKGIINKDYWQCGMYGCEELISPENFVNEACPDCLKKLPTDHKSWESMK